MQTQKNVKEIKQVQTNDKKTEVKNVMTPQQNINILEQRIAQLKIQLFDLNNDIKQRQNAYNKGMQDLQNMINQHTELSKINKQKGD